VSEEQTRCPNCGALTTPGAEWCGQCYTRLSGPEPTPAAPPPGGPAADAPTGHPGVPAPPMPTTPGAADAPPGDAGGGAASGQTRGTPASLLTELWELPTVPEPEVRGGPASTDSPNGSQAAPARSAGGDAAPERPRPTWPCAVCGASNDLELDACASCGAPFARLFEQQATPVDVEPKRAVAFSLAYPGLGHAVAGKRAEGLARGILFTWAAATAILLLTAHPAGGLGFLAPMALVFVLSAIVWYAVTALDAFRLASGERQLVTSKVMLYGVASLMLVSVASVLIMVTRAGRLH
jgi:hypothetical protein